MSHETIDPEPRLVALLRALERNAPQVLEGPALDLACGDGRHAIEIARKGIPTVAVDRDPGAIARLAERARAEKLSIDARVAELEGASEPGELEPGRYNLIVVFHYLHRPLCPAIRKALRPGGVLVYETFTRDQAQLGKPTNPAFLLERGELRELFAPLRLIAYCEGTFSGKALASLIGVAD